MTRLDITWDSFEGDLASLSRNARSAARGELRRNREAGVVIGEIDNLAGCAGRVHQLLDEHNRRLNGAQVPFGPGISSRHSRRRSANASLFTALGARAGW